MMPFVEGTKNQVPTQTTRHFKIFYFKYSTGWKTNGRVSGALIGGIAFGLTI
jgi:hypothetical protein